jgi:hypothetical protein
LPTYTQRILCYYITITKRTRKKRRAPLRQAAGLESEILMGEPDQEWYKSLLTKYNVITTNPQKTGRDKRETLIGHIGYGAERQGERYTASGVTREMLGRMTAVEPWWLSRLRNL